MSTSIINRTDVHCPKNIVPEDYEFVAFEYLKISGIDDCWMLVECRNRIRAHIARTGGTYSFHEHGGNCGVCGAHAVYTVLFYHAKSNTYIRTGQDCAAKLEMSCGNMNEFRRGIADALEHKAGKKKAEAYLEANELEEAWTIYTEYFAARKDMDDAALVEHWNAVKFEERTVIDIVGRLVKWGSISEKQIGFVRSLLEQITNRPQIEAAKAAKAIEDARLKELIPNVPCGRFVIRGEVVSVKSQEGEFGWTTKMLVVTEDGWKCWGTQWDGAGKGDTVEFVATVERSKDDPKFGWFSRPVAYTVKTITESKAAKINATSSNAFAGDYVVKAGRKIVKVCGNVRAAENEAKAIEKSVIMKVVAETEETE